MLCCLPWQFLLDVFTSNKNILKNTEDIFSAFLIVDIRWTTTLLRFLQEECIYTDEAAKILLAQGKLLLLECLYVPTYFLIIQKLLNSTQVTTRWHAMSENIIL